MKKLTGLTIIILLSIAGTSWSQDPNEPTQLPNPGSEIIHKIDSNTVRITTSIYIKKEPLLKQIERLESKIAAFESEIAEINKRLELFK